MSPIHLRPSVAEISSLVRSRAGNTIPIYQEIAADLLTPVSAYLKLTRHTTHNSFLFESVAGGEKIGRYSLLGAAPRKVVRVGDNEAVKGDPLKVVEKLLADVKFVPVPGVHHFTGGAVGYIAYDCVRFFEPKTARLLKDPLAIPDAIFMLCDTIVIFDHLHHLIKVVSHFKAPAATMTDKEIHAEYS
ncbi:hypothetical protein HDV05_003118, partial [Chytridiales sp. JEL 0842]